MQPARLLNRLLPGTVAASLLSLLVSATAPAATVVLENARVFDGQRDLGVASVVIEDGLIKQVGGAQDLPEDAQRIDYTGRYIIPGLVSDHSHVGSTQGTEHGDRFYTRENVERNLRQFQAFGITTVTALGLNSPLFHTLRQEWADQPDKGAQLLGAGSGIGVPEGAPPAAALNLEHDPIARPATAEEARAVVREQAELGIDVVKLWVDDLNEQVPLMTPEVYQAAIDEAHQLGLKVAAHIHDLAPARALIASGVDIIAHGIRDAAVDESLIKAMREAGTWYIATVQIDEANYLYATQPVLLDDPFLRAALQTSVMDRFADPQWREQQLASPGIASSRAAVAMNLRNLWALHKAGVRLGFGTDSGALMVRVIGFAEHRELELMIQAGLTPQEALTVATFNAAELLGLQDRGLLVPGRRADLVVLDKDPLQDIRNTRGIVAVWQAGEQVAGPVSDFSADALAQDIASRPRVDTTPLPEATP